MMISLGRSSIEKRIIPFCFQNDYDEMKSACQSCNFMEDCKEGNAPNNYGRKIEVLR